MNAIHSVVGTNLLGTAALANGKGGVLIGGDAYQNVIGLHGFRYRNIISGNLGNGVYLTSTTRQNVIIGDPLCSLGKP